jgi:hypothetical protein
VTQEFASSRGRTALLTVIAGMMTAAAWFAPFFAEDSIRYQALGPLVRWLGAPLFALATVMLLIQAIFPVTLKLDDQGFAAVGGLTGGYRVAWRDVESFQLWGGRGGSNSADGVSFTFRPGVRPKELVLALLSRPALPGFLKIEPEPLLDIMNQALEASGK